MKRFVWLVPAIFLFCLTAKAQDTPAWEVAGGYSYLYANLGNSSGSSSFGLQGGGGSISENLNNWFGGRAEVNVYHGAEAGTTVSAVTANYGPVFSYRKSDTFTPWASVQLGIIHNSQGYLGTSESSFQFGMVTGGGVDIKVSPRVAVRLNADYMYSHFLGLRQDNLVFGGGLVFRFGHK
jgi:opacity protein-like surface antigen